MEQSGPQQQAEGTGQPPKASSSSCSGGMGAAAPAAVPAADGAPAWRLAQRLLAGLRSLPPHTQSGSPGSQPLAAGPQAWPQEEQPQGQPGAELKEEEEQAALAPPAGDSLSPLGSMLLLPTSSDVAAAPAAVAEAPATAAPAAAAAAAANPREMLAVYSGLRYRYDGSGYHLPWDVRLRIPPRPGEARVPVDICRTATAEEVRWRSRWHPGPGWITSQSAATKACVLRC